jgi:glycosyltransferase involved in cell wall biosynthesis
MVMGSLNASLFQADLFLMKRDGVYWNEVPKHAELFFGTNKLRLRSAMLTVARKYLTLARSYDVLVGGLELESTYLAWLGGVICKKPVIGWVHVAMAEYLKGLPQWHRRATKYVYPRLDKIVCQAYGSVASLREVTSFAADRMHVMSYPFDIERVQAQSEGEPPWARCENKRPVIIGCGRLNHQKGFDVLIKAHKLALSAGLNHNLYILGEGPLRMELQSLIQQLKVADSVVMTGFLANPFPALRHASAFVMSSRFEGLPHVILEALAVGTPVISTDCQSGPAELLDRGKFGIPVPPEDPDALADALVHLLRNPAAQEEFRNIGPGRAAEYSPQRTGPQWEALLNEVRPN